MSNSIPTSTTPPLALDFKSAMLYTVRVVLHSHLAADLKAALDQRMRDAGSFFENEPVVIDATLVEEPLDWEALTDALRAHALHPIGVMAQGENLNLARTHGLTSVDLANSPQRPTSAPVPDKEVPVISPTSTNKPVKQEQAATPESAPAAMVVNHSLRSGQRVYARHTDLIIIGAVNQGAEVIADGNVHVYGPLRGKAMAGARGDISARIFTTQLDPELLAIAGVYRVIETKLDQALYNRPTLVRLEGETLKIVRLNT